MNALFIGGSKDGVTLNVPDKGLPIIHFFSKGSREAYRIQNFNVEGDIIHIFVHVSLTTKQAFMKLLENYKP